MIEWWHAVLIALSVSIATGLFTWGISYCQSRWSADAAIESDKRHTADRLAEEIRNARRDQRRRRAEVFYEFLAMMRRQLTAQDVVGYYELAYDGNLLGVKDRYKTKAEFMGSIVEKAESPTLTELGQVMRTVISVTNDKVLIGAFRGVLLSLQTGADKKAPYIAMQTLEDALETYVVEGSSEGDDGEA